MELLMSYKKVRVFFLLFCFLGLTYQGVSANIPIKKEVAQERYLSEILDEIGEKYQVFFNYESSLISNIKLNFKLAEAESLNNAVDRLMRLTNLKYELSSEKFVIIYRNDKQGKKKAKKVKRQIKKLQKLEKQGDIQIQRKSANPLKRSLNILDAAALFQKPAQTVAGTISNEAGEPLIGASVLIKGTSTGTVTDFDGNYSLSVEDGNAVLIFSYTGYEEQEVTVGARSVIDVTMQEGTVLDEVVVTALGLSRDKKSLGYSVTQVDGEELSRVKSSSPLQALRGKIAGVNISNGATGIKGSTRVVIRGNSTFGSNNQPLYIIDGISLQNQQLGSAGEWGGADNGDGLSAINPDDIKSISVLKGGAAAALYGSRASNGVIIIKTKDGKGSQKGLGIEVSNQTVFTSINDLYDPQTTYGNGIAGGFPTNQADAFNSWGPRLDGSLRTTYDGSEQPYEYAGDNLNRVFSTSVNTTNSIAVTSNTDKGSTRFSATHIDGKDVAETSKLKRLAFALNTSQKLSDKLTFDASVKFSDIDETANPIVSTEPASITGSLRRFAPNINVNDFIGDFGNGTTDGRNELLVAPNIFRTNPWFALHKNITSAEKERLLAAVSARYDITKHLYIRGQTGFDKATNHFNNQVINGAPLFWPGIAFNPGGHLYQQTQTIDQYDADVFLGTDRINISDNFAFDGFIGAGTFSVKAEDVGVFGDQVVIPGLNTVLNTASQAGLYGFQERKINSVYGSAQVSFADKIYLSTTLRNDWFSTLSAAGKTTPNNDLYGSASLSLLLSEMMELPEFISFAKIRGGYSQVAGGANDPYGLSLTYSLVGQGHLGNPLGQINGGTIPNSNITPFEKNETEIGLDLRMFNNRFSIDFAYYSNQTLRDIVNATASVASGFNSTTINLGEITNKGIELLLKWTAIEKKDFSLDLSLNYANNKSEVVRTDENDGIIQAGVAQLFQSNIGHMPGEPFGVIYGNSYVRDDQGRIVHEVNNGVPVPKSEGVNKVLGLGVPPTQMGFGTNLRYKNFTLNAFLEGKFGGSIVSNTNKTLKEFGLHQVTVPEGGRQNGFTPNGVLEDGGTITQSLSEAEIYQYWTLTNSSGASKSAIGEENVYKNDFIRISQLSLAYQIPNNLLEGIFINSASVSLVGNNLGFILNKVPNHDPEAYYNTRNGQGVEANSMPIGKSIGFSLNVKF